MSIDIINFNKKSIASKVGQFLTPLTLSPIILLQFFLVSKKVAMLCVTSREKMIHYCKRVVL